MAVKKKRKNEGYDTLPKGKQKADTDISVEPNEGSIYDEPVNPYTLSES